MLLAVLKHAEEHVFMISQLLQLRTQRPAMPSTFGRHVVLGPLEGSKYFLFLFLFFFSKRVKSLAAGDFYCQVHHL